MRVLSVEDIRNTPPPRWIIRRVIAENSFNVLYGYWGLGKSFVALDLSFRMSLGMSWFGYGVEQGAVVYVMAGEGVYGLGSRLRAWELYNNRDVEQDNLHFITEPVMLNGTESVSQFVKKIQRLDPQLVIFDTLARCTTGEENTKEGMGVVIGAVDEIRARTGAAVLLVHHSTKPDDEGHTRMRGHGSLDAAADTVIKLEERAKTNSIAILAEKVKEAKPFPVLSFQLEDMGESAVVKRKRF